MNINLQNQLLLRGKEVIFRALNDAQITVTEISDSISIYGYLPEEFISGKIRWRDIMHPEDKIYFTESTSEQEFRIISKSGEIFWLSCNFIEDEETGDFYVKVKDISRYITRKGNEWIRELELMVHKRTEELATSTEELKSANEELYTTNEELDKALSANRYQLVILDLLVEASGIGLWDMKITKSDDDPANTTQSITYSNEFRKLIGFSDEMDFPNILSSWSNRLHPDDKQQALNLFAAHILDRSGKTPYDSEYRLLKNNGEYGYFRCYGSTIRDSEGNALRVAGAFQDITEKKQKERQIIEMYENMTHILESLPIGIRIVRVDNGELVYANRASMDIFNCKDFEKDVAGRSAFDFMPEIQPDGRKTIDMANEFFAADRIAMEFQCFKLDGELFTARITSCNINYMEHPSSLAIIEDITDKKIADLELERYRTQLEQMVEQKTAELTSTMEKAQESDRLKSAFLANVSHEIRTPLNGIIGFLEILALETELSEYAEKIIKIAINNSDHLLRLLDDIIDIAKIETNQMELNPETFCINSLMEEIYHFFKNYLNISSNAQNVKLEYINETNIDPFIIHADVKRLKQVLYNLLNNAVKFTHKGYIRFGYNLIKNNNALEFFVEDTGIGIPENQLTHIFESFRQADVFNNSQYGGVGLGLTISRNLVQLMGGDLIVKSTVGSGSTFYFNINKNISDKLF